MITYNGTNIESAFNCHVFPVDVDDSPAKDYNVVTIPGRSGDLLIDGKRYKNVEELYKVVFADSENAFSNWESLKNYLLSQNGYGRLTDTGHPGEYRMAVILKDFEPTLTRERGMLKFDLEFNRKPQRFLTSGDEVTTLTASGTIENPTMFASRPLLRVYGAGVLGIGSQSVTITQADVYTDIDCEMMDAYKGTASKNGAVELSGYNFPVFIPGVNNISLGSGITQVEITPRWWKL